MKNLFNEIADWGENTFPESDTDSVMAHLAKEVDELFQDHLHDRFMGEEAADVVMLISHVARKEGFDLEDELRKKLEKNKSRQWVLSPEGTHWEHVRE